MNKRVRLNDASAPLVEVRMAEGKWNAVKARNVAFNLPLSAVRESMKRIFE